MGRNFEIFPYENNFQIVHFLVDYVCNRRIIKTMEDLTNNDIIQLVEFAKSAPEFMKFTKACFCVAQLTGRTPEEVIEICKEEKTGEDS